MAAVADTILEDAQRDRLAVLLQHFSVIEDKRDRGSGIGSRSQPIRTVQLIAGH